MKKGSTLCPNRTRREMEKVSEKSGKTLERRDYGFRGEEVSSVRGASFKKRSRK